MSGKQKILIVDDDMHIAELVAHGQFRFMWKRKALKQKRFMMAGRRYRWYLHFSRI